MARSIRPDWNGALHHVMVRGIEGMEVFSRKSSKLDLMKRLDKLVPEMDICIYAWSIMPNHFHFLLRTGSKPLFRFMHRLLTGFAVSYNKLNDRNGHVFQGRFRSLLVQDDLYLGKLVNYIHRNPIRAGIINGLGDLNNYRWCGHSSIMGVYKYPWFDRINVLSRFGEYPDSQILKYEQIMNAKTDEKLYAVLTHGSFVLGSDGLRSADSITSEKYGTCGVIGDKQFALDVYNRMKNSGFAGLRRRSQSHLMVSRLLHWVEKNWGFTRLMMRGESRSPGLSDARAVVAWVLFHRCGFSQSNCMEFLAMSRNGVKKAIQRGNTIIEESQFIRENKIW